MYPINGEILLGQVVVSRLSAIVGQVVVSRLSAIVGQVVVRRLSAIVGQVIHLPLQLIGFECSSVFVSYHSQ